jgi:eukaryotic-like serine/threonine-protein kinase
VNAAGGTLTPVTVVDTSLQENTHRNPSFLPDGHHFLYSVLGSSDRGGVYLGSLDGKTKKRLIPVRTSAVYAHPGYVLFVNGDGLFGQAFDADRLELKGQPFFVADHVGRSTSNTSAVSASLTGTVAYGPLLAQNGRLTWIDRRGNPLGSPGTRDRQLGPSRTIASDLSVKWRSPSCSYELPMLMVRQPVLWVRPRAAPQFY